MDKQVSFDDLIVGAKKILYLRELSDDSSAGTVSCALLANNGKIYKGVCIDTPCSMGFCAEHSAIASMITDGESRILKIVAINLEKEEVSPCGRCREFIYQINNANINTEIMIHNRKVYALHELLPHIWDQ